jgi:ectoine hydroxylase-related dioxygenase (phytanoyl-CoA dioxygenase family)
MADITQNILAQVLPKTPNKLFVLNLWRFLVKLQFGSLLLLLIQYWKKEFYMERHLDSAAVWRLCQDPELLKKVKEHLGEELVLWRSEIWVNYPSQQLIPLWHQDSYPKLLEGVGKSINVYIALTDVNEFNGFEYIPRDYLKDNNYSVKITDPFSGNNFFDMGEDLEKKAIPVVLDAGQFILFSEQLIHRSTRNSSGKVRVSITLRITQPTVRVLPKYTSNYKGPVFLSNNRTTPPPLSLL